MSHEVDWNTLFLAAKGARGGAYAPYSKFHVGAALCTSDGEVFTGANVENASYPLSMCAERNAIATAVNAGHQSFSRLVVIGPGESPVPMCGACRQVLIEFAADSEVRCYAENGQFNENLASELLPGAFDPAFLKE